MGVEPSQVKNNFVAHIAKTTNNRQEEAPKHFQEWYNATKKIAKDLSNLNNLHLYSATLFQDGK